MSPEPLRHLTTLRLDTDLRDRVVAQADRLGIRRAELIRNATREYVLRLEEGSQLALLEQRVEGLAQAVELLARRLRVLTTFLPSDWQERLRLVRADAGRARSSRALAEARDGRRAAA